MLAGNVDAVAHLLYLKTNFVGRLRADDIDFGIFPGFDFDAAIRNIVNHDDRPARDLELLFNVLPGRTGLSGRGAPEKKSGA